MRCLDCNADNLESATVCTACGASLRPARASSYLDHAEQHINKGEYELASKSIVKADVEMLGLSSEQRDRYLLTARAFWLQGGIYYSRGKMEEAREELLLARQNLEARPAPPPLLSVVMNKLGNLSYYQGDIDEAMAHYQRSAEVAIAAHAPAAASRAFNNIALTLAESGQIEEAISYYRRALEQLELEDDPSSTAQTYAAIAWLYSQRGPFSLALDYATLALGLRHKIANQDTRCLVICETATLFAKQGDPRRAAPYLQEAYELAQHSGNKIAQEAVAMSLTELMYQQGDFSTWFSYVLKSLTDSAANPVFNSEHNLRLAVCYIGQGDPTAIRRHLSWMNSSVTEDVLNSEDETTNHRTRALLHTALREWEAAERYFQLALAGDTFSKYDLACTWDDYGAMLLRYAELAADPAAYPRAHEALSQAAALYRELELPRRLASVEAMLKVAHAKRTSNMEAR